MSDLSEHPPSPFGLRRTGTPAFGALALAFEPARRFEVEHGKSIAEIVAGLIGEGLIEAGLAPYLTAFVGDREIAREDWDVTTPAPGQLLALRVRPGYGSEWLAAVVYWVNIAVTVASAAYSIYTALNQPDPLDPVGPVFDVRGASNEAALYAPVPAVLGKFRCFPRHAARQYTEAFGEKVFLRVLLCWGVGAHDLDAASLQIGDTLLSTFAGVEVQHRLKPSDPWPTVFPSSADEDPGPGLLEFADGWVERTTSADDADELQVEIFFFDGLIFIKKDGSLKPFSVDIRVRYREDGTSDWLAFDTGAVAPEGSLHVISAKQRKPWRETLKRTVPRGKYDVAVKRVSADDPGPKGHNAFHWSKLRTFTFDPAVSDDNLAVTALKIEAGDQLNGVLDLVNGVVTRRAPIWNAMTETWGPEGPTQNPAELVRWIAMGPASPKPRAEGELDQAAFGAWAELCTANDWRCDMELRQGAALEEIQQIVARCGRAVLGERAGKLTPIIDDVQASAVQLFTPRNSWGFQGQRRYPSEAHALRVEFANEEKNYVGDEILVFFDGFDENNAELIETVRSVGKTRPVEAFRDGRRAIAERVLRQEEFAWRADIENLVCARGQRVAVQHFTIAVGIKSARVKAHVLNVAETHVTALVLDEIVDQVPGPTYGLKWRKHVAGVVSVESLALTNTGAPTDTVTLAAEIPIASAPAAKTEEAAGDLVTFGEGGIETLDLVVQDIARSGAFEAEFSAVRYTADLFNDDSTALPAWSSNVSGDAFPRPPAPEILSATASPDGFFVRFDFPAGEAERVESVEAYWRPADETGSTFELVVALPGTARLAPFPGGESGLSYTLKLVAVGARDTRTASAEVTLAAASVASVLPLERSATVSQMGRTLTKEAGGAAWDAHAFSLSSYVGGVFCSAYASQIDAAVAFGFNSDPATDASFASIDYAVVLEADGTWKIAENGFDVWDIDEAYVEDDVFSLLYDNASVRVFKNGVLKRQTDTTPSLRFFFDCSLFTVGGQIGGIEFGPSGGAGAPTFTLVRSIEVSQAGRALKKESGVPGWNAEARSIESFAAGAFCSARGFKTDRAVAFGLTSDPEADDNYTSIDYCWQLDALGKLRIYENGVLAWDNGGAPESYSAFTALQVLYDGSATGYYKDGVLKRTVTAPANLRLHFDSSFHGVGAQLGEVAFGPAGTAGLKQEARYKRSVAPPKAPTEDFPTDWTRALPPGTAALWMTTGLKTAAGVLAGVWSTPVLVTAPNFRGAFSAGETYYIEDAVTKDGGTYRCRVAEVVHSLLLDGSAADPQLRSPSGLTIAGATYTRVRARARCTSGAPTFEGDLFYTTGGHGFSASFHKVIAAPADYAVNVWLDLEWDMTALTAGGSDWTSNTITQLRFDFANVDSDWEVDWIEVADTMGNVAVRWGFAAGVESFTGTNASVSHSGAKAPTGTAEANAWWDVIAAPGAPGEPGTAPSAFNATIDLVSSNSGVNLRTVADAAGYTGLSDATIAFEVESGVTITGLAGAPDGGIAIDTGTWPTGAYTIALTLTIKSGGIVRGGGGKGGNGSSGGGGFIGGKGGDAVHARVPLTVNVNAGGELKSGGGGGGGGGGFVTGGGGGGGGGGGCVVATMFMADGRRAGDVVTGDVVETIEHREPLQLTRAEVLWAGPKVEPCVRLVSESGVALECSQSTPITQPDGSTIYAGAALGGHAVVRDARGLRWERIAVCESIGEREVAHIYAGGATYSAGVEPDAFMFTHNQEKN